MADPTEQNSVDKSKELITRQNPEPKEAEVQGTEATSTGQRKALGEVVPNAQKGPKSDAERVKVSTEELEKTWKNWRRKLIGKFEGLKGGDRDNAYQFQFNRTMDYFVKGLDSEWLKFKRDIDQINFSSESADKKVKNLGDLKNQIDEALKTSYGNVVALLDKMMPGEYKITREALVKLQLEAPLFMELMRSEKGKELAGIFTEFTTISTLGEGRGAGGEKLYTTLEKSLLDPGMERVAFFVLTMAREKVREEFTRKFMTSHQDKVIWVVEMGSRYGCYSARQVREHYEFCKREFGKTDATSNTRDQAVRAGAAARAEKELGDFTKYEKAYETRYNSMAVVKRGFDSMATRDARNPALQSLTFGGIGRAIGYMASTITLLANIVANKDTIKENPASIFKNVYVVGSLASLGYLRQTAGGKRVKEIFQKPDKEKVGLARLKECLEIGDSRWGNFFMKGGSQLVADYSASLVNKTGIDKVPTMEGFVKYCEDNKKTLDNNERAGEYWKETMGNKDLANKAQGELGNFIYLFRELKVSNKQDFANAVDRMKSTLT
jgi:hypothetical protein